MTGLSESQAEDTLRRYFATYPRMDDWLRTQAKSVLSDRTARTLSGRIALMRV
ncbi:MAG: hypothetical protein R2682_14105 [Pyrinomonadaceae bacterium]